MESKETSCSYDKCLDGFKHAVVHIAVIAPPEMTRPLQLLYASVWLLAPGRQPPARPTKPFIKRFKNVGSIVVDRVVMSAEEAIRWYRSDSHKFNTPFPLQSVREGCDGIPLAVEDLSDYPKWPILGVPMEGEDLSTKDGKSSIPYRNYGIIRYSRRISNNQRWPDFLDINGQGKKCLEAFQFLEHHMHIDFREYPEYLGGMVLAAPDRDVYSIRQFIDTKEDGSESLYFHLKPHPGRKLENFSLTTFEGQEGMLTSFETYQVPLDGLIEINRPSTIDTAGLILTHKDRGVLLQTPMRPFLRQMNLRTEVVERRYRASVPETDGKNSAQNEYTTDRKTLASAQTYGEHLDNTHAYRRLLDAKHERSLNNGARIYEQTWFTTDQRKEALDHIRDKLRNARSSIFIADPYFGANQIDQFLYAIERDRIQIKILTSQNALKTAKPKKASNGKVSALQNPTTQLLEQAKNFTSFYENDLEIKVAKAKDSLFHDRFLAIDGRVWMLGSSLNSIGVRPTLIMRIPHGEKILSQLLSLYNKSSELKAPSEVQDKADG